MDINATLAAAYKVRRFNGQDFSDPVERVDLRRVLERSSAHIRAIKGIVRERLL